LQINAQGVPASAVAQAIFDQLWPYSVRVYYGEQLSSKQVSYQEIIPIASSPALERPDSYGYLLAKMRGVLGVVVASVRKAPWPDGSKQHWFVSTDGSASSGGQGGQGQNSPGSTTVTVVATPPASVSPQGQATAGGGGAGSSTAGDATAAGGGNPSAATQQAGAKGSQGQQGESAQPAEYIRLYQEGSGYALTAGNTSSERIIEAFQFLGVDRIGGLKQYLTPLGRIAGSSFIGPAVNFPYPVYDNCLDALAKDVSAQLATTISNKSVVATWPVTFLGSDTPNPTVAAVPPDPSQPTPEQASMTKMATALQALDTTGATQVQAVGSRLVINGPHNTVEQMRRILAQWIDIPYSQVRLDFYVLQGTSRLGGHGERKDVNSNIETIRQAAAISRAVQHYLKDGVDSQIHRFTESTNAC
jgi:hypothetical protein